MMVGVARRTFFGATTDGGGGEADTTIPLVADEDARDAMFPTPTDGQLVVVADSDGDGLLQLQVYADGWEWVGPQVEYPTAVTRVADTAARDAIVDPGQGLLVLVGDQLHVRWDAAWIPVTAGLDPADYLPIGGGTLTGGLTISAGGLGVTGTTNLGAVSVGAVTGSSSVQLIRSAAGSATYVANVSGDSQYRYLVGADGKISWGSGSATQDTNLYRHAADTLKTDDALVVGGALSAARILVNVYADAAARDAAVTSPATGTVVYVTGVGFQVYTGSTWSTIGPSAGASDAMTWAGAYSALNSYADGAVVTARSSLYVANQAVSAGSVTELLPTDTRNFETGTGSWTVYSGSAGLVRDTGKAHGGSASLKATASGPGALSLQYGAVTVTANTSYTMQFWVWTDTAGIDFRIDVNGATVEAGSDVRATASAWTLVERVFTTGPGITSIYVRMVCVDSFNTHVFWADDVTLYASPSPVPSSSYFDQLADARIGSAVLLMRRANDLNLTANVEGVIPFDATDYDPYSWWVSASNHFLPTLAGWYEVTAACTFGAGSSFNKFIRVKKNGTGVNGGEMRITQSAEVTLSRTCLVLLNGTSDYVSVFAQVNGSMSPAIISTAGPQASMHVTYAGPNIS